MYLFNPAHGGMHVLFHLHTPIFDGDKVGQLASQLLQAPKDRAAAGAGPYRAAGLLVMRGDA